MDIGRLNYFIVAAEEQSISRAAARLNITQPPLTRHIHALEEELGVLLFTRTSSGISLTQAGQDLLVHARNIRASVELATEQIRCVASGYAGRIDIGIFGSAMLYAIPRILEHFSESHPEVKVVANVAPKGRQIEALQQKNILIAFDRYLPEAPDLQVELVSREAVLVAINRLNPMVSKKAIGIEDLRSETLIGERDASVMPAVAALFLQHGFEPRIEQRAVDMITAVVMVSGGLGSAIVPESMQYLQLPNVIYRPLVAKTSPAVDLHCAYRKDERSPLLTEFLKSVRVYSALSPCSIVS